MGAVELVLTRHGESLGNVAAAKAEADEAEFIEVLARDADVELSDTGQEQARSLGALLKKWSPDQLPQSVWSSPYRRAADTGRLALDAAGLDLPLRIDERLRDRELGVLDRLTTRGVEARFPEEAARRRWLGKFYHRPPGGESWADLALRMRSLLADVDRVEDGRRVLLVCHDAMVVVTRYVCEGLSESDVLDITRTTAIRNVSVTRLRRPSGEGEWTLDLFNDVSHLEKQDVPVTRHPGVPDVAPR
ncbi:MAG TPA: histidine phosphatase family protein [Nocardioidaceae bacterium]|nr:histidine phosphatase family protein [Nocardioidaceae bacterium]